MTWTTKGLILYGVVAGGIILGGLLLGYLTVREFFQRPSSHFWE